MPQRAVSVDDQNVFTTFACGALNIILSCMPNLPTIGSLVSRANRSLLRVIVSIAVVIIIFLKRVLRADVIPA